MTVTPEQLEAEAVIKRAEIKISERIKLKDEKNFKLRQAQIAYNLEVDKINKEHEL
tara:strand:+ start:254 stop:421 length:168 start_codon:yes stop_codon:yes gene_type:complete